LCAYNIPITQQFSYINYFAVVHDIRVEVTFLLTCQVLGDGALLLQDSDCGTVAKQMYDNLTSSSDNSVRRQKRICLANNLFHML